MRYIITFFIVLLVLAIFVISFLLFKEKFDTEIPLSKAATEPDDFLQAIGITDPSSQLLISNSKGDLSLLSLSKLKAGINKVSQDGIKNNNTYYTTTADLPNTYTTTADLQKNYTTTADLNADYIKKGHNYSIKMGPGNYAGGNDKYMQGSSDNWRVAYNGPSSAKWIFVD